MQNETMGSNPSDNREAENEHFLVVQATIFKDLIAKEGVTDVRSFIAGNAHLFRYFATHLPDDLKESWKDAELNDESRMKLETQYEIFHSEIDSFTNGLEPEIKLGLEDAIRNGDTDLASYILENTFKKQITK